MDTAIFIAWFKFHNIPGQLCQKLFFFKWWLIIAFRRSVKSIQNISCRFLLEGHSFPLPHGSLYPIDCAAASLLCFMNSACTAYPLYKCLQVMWFRLWMIDEPANILVRSLSEHEQLNFAPKFCTNKKFALGFALDTWSTWIEPFIFMGIIIIVKLKA